MGNLMTGRALRGFTRAAEPTPLLTYLAGDFASDVANVWPAPHDGFFALPAGRRHAAALLLRTHVPASAEEKQDLVDRVTYWRDRDLAQLIAGQAKGNFMHLLGKLGEVLWSSEDYTGLLNMQARYEIAYKLRHTAYVTPLTMRLAALLPDVFVRPKILGAITDQSCAEDVIEAVRLVRRGASEPELKRLAGNMAKGQTAGKVFDLLGAALLPEVFQPLIAVPRLGDQFIPVTTRKQLKAVALEFKNCLRDYESELASGENAVFVWTGMDKAVLSLTREAMGWALEEARLVGNKPLPPAVLLSLVGELMADGVWVGTTRVDLKRRLHGHGCADCGAPTYPPYPDWRGELKKAAAVLEAT